MEKFELYFQRADLDRDGRISGAEAVSFFQGSNLPKPVLAQIWTHADEARTGFLGRPEFFKALKLVTVAQSKRELTPDIVKAALYGPASAKIPAPQINLAAVPAPQVNSVASSAPSQMGPVTPASSQTPGFRGQVPLSSSNISQLYGPPHQVNQTMRPPLPPAPSNAFPPPWGNVAAPVNSSAGSASDWLGGSNHGISQPMPSASAKPQGSLPSPMLSAAKDTRPSIGSGDGFASGAVFGGDVFSATQSVPKQIPAQAANKLDPFELLQSSLPRQPAGKQVQPNQPPARPNQQVSTQITSSVGPSGGPVGPGNPAPSQPQPSWPKMTKAGIQKYTKVFVEVDTDRDGKITGEQARNLFLSWRLPREVLKQVWELSDQDDDSMLSLREFCIALYLMERYREGHTLPAALPSNLLLDEALLSLTGQPSAAYGNPAWGPSPGFRPQQGFQGPHPVKSADGARPPLPVMSPQGGGATQFDQQKARVLQMESSNANQPGNGDRNSVDTFEDSAESEKKVEEKEKLILDSKEKLEFFRTKMQDLVLYKSRCDNRLNEITERALADNREAELLGKKYEEKYKLVAEQASKLTLEEAAFREIQERKMELQQALVKMEQGGSADGILQVRADRIQSDVEELMRGLSERCKKHGIDIKSAALIELPIGWHPGVPEISSVWDEDWDKFEDEGFSFDVFTSSKSKPTSVEKENYSGNGSLSPDLMSHDDNISEKADNNVERVFESESAYAHSEDELGKSPSESRAGRDAFESPSGEYSDNHFKRSPEMDDETHGFDESGWGSFDNNDDIDSVWGFDAGNSKESDRDKHGEKHFFGSSEYGDSSRRVDSPTHLESSFPKKSAFAFEDSVPSTPFSRADNSSPRHGMGSSGLFFDNSSRFDSFNMNDHTFSPRKNAFSRFDSMSSDRGFDQTGGSLSRFDSMNSTAGFDHGQRFSSFDDNDPFGSSGPFRVSTESQTPKKDSDKWGPF